MRNNTISKMIRGCLYLSLIFILSGLILYATCKVETLLKIGLYFLVASPFLTLVVISILSLRDREIDEFILSFALAVFLVLNFIFSLTHYKP